MEALLNILAEFGSALIEPLAAFVTIGVLYYAKKWFNISADEKFRNALHGAIERGMTAAGNRVHQELKGGVANIDIRNKTLQKTVDYVAENSPDALKHFNLTPERLAGIVADQLPAFDDEQPARMVTANKK